LQFIKTVVEHYQLKIIVYDPIQEAIVEWKN
jgi:GH35 family endo-1,4-beta-xylanase